MRGGEARGQNKRESFLKGLRGRKRSIQKPVCPTVAQVERSVDANLHKQSPRPKGALKKEPAMKREKSSGVGKELNSPPSS